MDQEGNTNQALGGVEINETAPKSGKTGPTIGIIIIIILILLGGLYYLKSAKKTASERARDVVEERVDARTQELLDKANNLENRLNSLNLDEVDSEASAINESLGQ